LNRYSTIRRGVPLFVSYAQNYEDVMLWRALKHVKEGFYIDVGAAWPESASVTKAFYDRNWHGINIEPNLDMWRLLAASRPKDINLRLALSDQKGREDFYIVENAGLSTLIRDVVAVHEANGLRAKKNQIEVSTLADVWQENVGAHDVHFLKIDVEGAERQVLLGNNWSSYRPWIIVVEATLPMTQISSYEAWESIILRSDYQMAYDDGLNRFYVADERRDILPAFSSPPNVFDNFVLADQLKAEARAKAAETRAQAAEARAQAAEARADLAESRSQITEARAQAAEVTAHKNQTRLHKMETRVRWAQARAQKAKVRLAKMKATLSWKVTRPIRIIGKAVSRRLGQSR
jgi:FkbM family methyltransferase